MCVPVTRVRSERARAMLRCACMLALMALVAADKRSETHYLSPVPFVVGSRYGRSPPRALAARNDRFLMSSRYGKRSDAAPGSLTALVAAVLCRPPEVYRRHPPRPYPCNPAPPVAYWPHTDRKLPAAADGDD